MDLFGKSPMDRDMRRPRSTRVHVHLALARSVTQICFASVLASPYNNNNDDEQILQQTQATTSVDLILRARSNRLSRIALPIPIRTS